MGVIEGIDPKNLAEAGWGVIFASNANPGIREALKELLDYRREQVTNKNERYYREYSGERAYRPGESTVQFLARNGIGPGPADKQSRRSSHKLEHDTFAQATCPIHGSKSF